MSAFGSRNNCKYKKSQAFWKKKNIYIYSVFDDYCRNDLLYDFNLANFGGQVWISILLLLNFGF